MVPTPIVDVFTRFKILQRAAVHKGLILPESASDAYSEPLKVYNLDDKLLAVLAERGIKRQARPKYLGDVFTLADENPRENIPGCQPTNYWNFRLQDDGVHFDLRVSVFVSFVISTEKRGVIFWPQAHSSFLSAGDQLSNFRMFKALVESDDDPSAVAKEIAASDGSIVVSWTDLGLGGLRGLDVLFAEFAKGNATVMRLGGDRGIFAPVPNPDHQQPGDKLFVTEPAQPGVFETWRSQLKDYRDRLDV